MPPNSLRKPYDQIVLFGDSITQWSNDTEAGFALQPALQSMYSRRLDVINRGFSGYNTAHAILALPDFMPSPHHTRVKLLVIFFGANDACVPSDPGGQHVPLETYRHNLIGMVQHASVQEHDPKIVIVTPPPIDEHHLVESGFPPGGRLAEVTARYARAAKQVAEEKGIPCCDLWTAIMMKATDGRPVTTPMPGDIQAPRNKVLGELLVDGLHFTPAAYKLWFDCLQEVILKRIPDLDPEKIALVFPPWGDAPKGM